MVNRIKKTHEDVNNQYEQNRHMGIKTERELELLREQVEDYAAQHAAMTTNATQDMDSVVERVRQQVRNNVNQVLSGKNIESQQVQDKQLNTAQTAQVDAQGALQNKRLEENVSQAVVNVIGHQEHEAVKLAFSQEAEFHGHVSRQSQQDQQQVQRTTQQTNVVVDQTLSRLNNLI
jgi:maltodextrin utilization protein YvdJ